MAEKKIGNKSFDYSKILCQEISKNSSNDILTQICDYNP